MAKDPAAHVDRLEKAYLELQEQHAKSCDNISQMMEMLKILTKEKVLAKHSAKKETAIFHWLFRQRNLFMANNNNHGDREVIA